jgi:hypothetical protein
MSLQRLIDLGCLLIFISLIMIINWLWIKWKKKEHGSIEVDGDEIAEFTDIIF